MAPKEEVDKVAISEEVDKVHHKEKKKKKNYCNKIFGCNMMCIDNSLILHINIIVRKYYHTYFELIHAFYIGFGIRLNNQFCT